MKRRHVCPFCLPVRAFRWRLDYLEHLAMGRHFVDRVAAAADA